MEFAGSKVGITSFEPIAFQHFGIFKLTGPACGAVVETSFARILLILEQLGIAGQIGNFFEIRCLGFDIAFGIPLNQVSRDIPALSRTNDRRANANDFSALGGFVTDLASPHPLLGQNLDVVAAQRTFHGDGIARNGVDLTAVTFL